MGWWVTGPGALLRRAVRSILSSVAEYQLYGLYTVDRSVSLPALPDGYRFAMADAEMLAALAAHPDAKTAKAARFMITGAYAHAVLADGVSPAAIAFFYDSGVFGSHDILPLGACETALVELVTAPEHRGRGLASALIAESSNAMFERGSKRQRAWIWWSNTPSIRAFRKAGWRRTGFTLQFRVGAIRIALRLGN